MSLGSEHSEPIVKKIKSLNNTKDLCDVASCKQKNEVKRDDDLEGVDNGGNIEIDNDDRTSEIDDDDTDSFQFPPDDDVSDMLEDVEYHGSFPTITDRYFTAYYKLDVQCPRDDIRILVHSNRICMLTLAPSHMALQSGKEITKVDFKVSEKLDRTMNKVSGKSKHGAQPLQANSNICMISCSSGETYMIKCCMIGKLVEVNEALLENPKLLSEPPHRGGYLAIVLPNIKLLEKMKETLLTEELYKSAILERQSVTISSEPEAMKLEDSENSVKDKSSEMNSSQDDVKKTENNVHLTSNGDKFISSIES